MRATQIATERNRDGTIGSAVGFHIYSLHTLPHIYTARLFLCCAVRVRKVFFSIMDFFRPLELELCLHSTPNSKILGRATFQLSCRHLNEILWQTKTDIYAMSATPRKLCVISSISGKFSLSASFHPCRVAHKLGLRHKTHNWHHE